ncbi:MAG: putative lipoprotein [Candidatus Binatia bacterium]|nr:putative lipoprotein [Candidatus Binatia bacterium]
MYSTGNLTLAAVLALSLASAGCSFSYSSESISDSLAGSSKSVSDSLSSSSPDGESKSEQAYREDVRDFTASAARSGRTVSEVQGGLGTVAERHGVTNWGADAATFVGIGEGLRRAGFEPDHVQVWSAALVQDAAAKIPADRLIQQGYDARRS